MVERKGRERRVKRRWDTWRSWWREGKKEEWGYKKRGGKGEEREE